MSLDYIERENNKLADLLAREGSSLKLSGDINYRVIFSLEKVIDNVSFKWKIINSLIKNLFL